MKSRIPRCSMRATCYLLSQVVDYFYNPNGTLKTLTDENGHVTTWNRDSQSRVTSKVYANNQQTTYNYEASTSRLKSQTDAKGQTKQYSYDNNNQLTAINYLNAAIATPNVSVNYDPYFPRVTSMTDGTGSTQYQYHPLGQLGAQQLAKQDGPYQNDTITYQYDALGRVTTRTIDNTPETFSYDNLGRITNHNSALANFKRSYQDQSDLLTGQHSIPTANSVSVGTDWQYCLICDHHLKQITHSGSTRSYTIARTPDNKIEQIQETASSGSTLTPETWNYYYDATDRLTSAKKIIAGIINNPVDLTYDPADNITQLKTPANTSNFSVNTVNQITTHNTNPVNYDNNGNLTQGTTQFTNLHWDAENRLVKAEINPDQYYTFSYDGLNRRIAANYTYGSQTTENRYLWCGEQLCEKRNVTDNVIGRYFDEGEIDLTSNIKAYYARDQLGNVRDVLDIQTGNLIRAVNYAPTGKITAALGSFEPEFEFAGMQSFPFMSAGNLQLTHHRLYDPSLARWLSRDPIEEAGGINLYSYVGGDFVNRVDPLGLQTTVDAAIQNAIRQGNITELRTLAEAVNPEQSAIIQRALTPARDLIRGSLKRVKDYPSEIEEKSFAEICKMASDGGELASKAKKLKKLIQAEERLLEKY